MKKKSNSILGMAFFGPALVLMTVFLFIPMILTLIYSFTDYFALNPKLTHFVGMENFSTIFKDDLFTTAFGNTVKFVLIIVPLQTLGALGLALLINKVTVCKKYFKVAFFIPVVMSLAVVSNLWMQIYSPEGILNTILSHFGIDAQPFIYGANQALPSIALMSVWQGVGYQMIIFLGGLQAINPALYEAAEMDHASGWSKFKNITLPKSVVAKLNGRQGTLVLGIRGEDIKLDPQNLDLYKENIMSATVDSVEVMGNENNLYFNFGGTPSVARVSKYEISKPGDTIDFAFVPSRMHFFDTQTEESLF